MDKNDRYINNYTKEFDKLVSERNLSIDTLENIMINNIEQYEKVLRQHVEELIKTHINEKDLITKKTRMERKRV